VTHYENLRRPTGRWFRFVASFISRTGMAAGFLTKAQTDRHAPKCHGRLSCSRSCEEVGTVAACGCTAAALTSLYLISPQTVLFASSVGMAASPTGGRTLSACSARTSREQSGRSDKGTIENSRGPWGIRYEPFWRRTKSRAHTRLLVPCKQQTTSLEPYGTSVEGLDKY